MSILHIHKLFSSSHEAWDAFSHSQFSVLKLFTLLVVPFSQVPPVMLEYAGHHYGATLFPDTSRQAWSMAAFFFMVAELITVPLMAWGIKAVANSRGIASDYRGAFLLAAIAPIPLWLSALALFSDRAGVIVGVIVLGLAASVLLIYRGVQSILQVEEDIVAFDIAHIVTALGLIAWVLLLMLGLVPALS